MKPFIKLLSDEEVRHIDRESRDILTKVGFICEDEEAVEIYAKAGASIEGKNHVRFTEKIIDDAIAANVPVAKVYGRNGREPLEVGGDNVYFGTTGFATNYLDVEKNEYRPSTYQDQVEMMKLCEMLDPPDYMLPSIGITDVEPEYDELYQFKAGMLYSTKHIETEALDLKNAAKIIKMAEFMAGGEDKLKEKPFLSFLITLTSPLHQRSDATQLTIFSAKYGIPLFVESGPMGGATAPVTLKDNVAIANAEILADLALAKMVNPSIPFVYASWARVLNMKSGLVSVGAPEFGMLRVATTQMGKFYNLPTGGGSNVTDSLSLDPQLGAEQMATSILPALAGINMAQCMGLHAGMNATCSETLIIANEIANYAKRIARGIDVNMSAEGFDLISQIGPCHDFLATDHTLKNFKKELWTRTIFDCSPVKNEGKHVESGVMENVIKRKSKLLKKYKQPEAPANAEETLEKIIRG